MAIVKLSKHDLLLVENPPPNELILGFDLDGILKKKDEFGVITPIEGGGGIGLPRYYVGLTENLTIPDGSINFVYGDLTIDGILTNYGKIVIINGALIENGTFNNFGTLQILAVPLI